MRRRHRAQGTGQHTYDIYTYDIYTYDIIYYNIRNWRTTHTTYNREQAPTQTQTQTSRVLTLTEAMAIAPSSQILLLVRRSDCRLSTSIRYDARASAPLMPMELLQRKGG